MVKYIYSLAFIFIGFTLQSQYSISTTGIPSTADLSVAIGESIRGAKMKVMIGQDLNTSNFSIGFTNNPPDADVTIIDAKTETDLKIIKTRLSNSNISVQYGESIINPDVRINVIESGEVDYLIYYETEEFNVESVVMGLLPLINAELGYKYDMIPYYGPEGGPPQQGTQQSTTIQPLIYKNMNVAHWIISIDGGVIQLDDRVYFYVYDDDRYILQQWREKNDVVVSPTTVPGHYYITRNGGIYKEDDTLRAVCFQPAPTFSK